MYQEYFTETKLAAAYVMASVQLTAGCYGVIVEETVIEPAPCRTGWRGSFQLPQILGTDALTSHQYEILAALYGASDEVFNVVDIECGELPFGDATWDYDIASYNMRIAKIVPLTWPDAIQDEAIRHIENDEEIAGLGDAYNSARMAFSDFLRNHVRFLLTRHRLVLNRLAHALAKANGNLMESSLVLAGRVGTVSGEGQVNPEDTDDCMIAD